MFAYAQQPIRQLCLSTTFHSVHSARTFRQFYWSLTTCRSSSGDLPGRRSTRPQGILFQFADNLSRGEHGILFQVQSHRTSHKESCLRSAIDCRKICVTPAPCYDQQPPTVFSSACEKEKDRLSDVSIQTKSSTQRVLIRDSSYVHGTAAINNNQDLLGTDSESSFDATLWISATGSCYLAQSRKRCEQSWHCYY